MSLESDFLGALEVHSPDEIRAALANGANAAAPMKSQTPVETLISGYLRSPRFGDCLRLLLEAGGTVGDALLEAILFDDTTALLRELNNSGNEALARQFHVATAFTSCHGVTALHLCAEFNSVNCARVLVDAGANIDAAAETDIDGFGGQTPIFHAVNSIKNYCRPMMDLLVDVGADLNVALQGLIWGPGQDWETLILDVTPLSYAQCGLYSQFHRPEQDVYSNVDRLYQKRHGRGLPIRNVPNKYLAPKS